MKWSHSSCVSLTLKRDNVDFYFTLKFLSKLMLNSVGVCHLAGAHCVLCSHVDLLDESLTSCSVTEGDGTE